MTRFFGMVAAVATVAALLAPQTAGAEPPSEPGTVPGAWIVTLHDGSAPGAVAADHARSEKAQVSHVYTHALNGYAAHFSDQAAARIAADPRVRSVVPDREVSTTVQGVPTGITRIGADTNPTANIDGVDDRVDVDVAVIDTGIDSDHPDLNVVDGFNCSTGTSWEDGNGHGSHVAGTIGALDNGIGVVGVAPGARLYGVRVLNAQGSGTWSQIICGIDWVTQRADVIEVANMSLGGAGGEGTCTDGGLHEAICNSIDAGITYVVAAGNESRDASTSVPARFDEVITVSALADYNGAPGGGAPSTCYPGTDDSLALFSNYGADVDIIAPGVCIESAWRNGGYATISGTSMASPHVAGAAALLAADDPTASPADIRAMLLAAGTQDWNTASDRDNFHEPLLDVSGGASGNGIATSTTYTAAGRNGQHALVTVHVSENGAALSGVSTNLDLYSDGSLVRSYVKTTDGAGDIVLKVRNGSLSCVTVDVVTVGGVAPATEVDPGSNGC